MFGSTKKYEVLQISFVCLLASASVAFRSLPLPGGGALAFEWFEGPRCSSKSSCTSAFSRQKFTTATKRSPACFSKLPKFSSHIAHRVPRSGWPEGLWRDLGQPMLSIRAGSLKKSHLNFIEKHLSSSSNRFLKIKVVLNGPCGENDSAAVAWGISHALMDRMQVDILQIRDTGILIARIDALMHVLSLFMTCRRTQCAIL